jgi:hypothetical protein
MSTSLIELTHQNLLTAPAWKLLLIAVILSSLAVLSCRGR